MFGSWGYLAAIAVYLVFFGLFLRFFVWKRYADKNYWLARPQLTVEKLQAEALRRGKPMPRFSVLIPARNEADVIGRTVEHMCRLRYPASHYEVIVVTDEKERLAREATRPQIVAEAGRVLARRLQGAGWQATNVQAASPQAGSTNAAPPNGGRAHAGPAIMLAAGWLCYMAQPHWQPGSRLGRALGWGAGMQLDPRAERALVREMAYKVIERQGRVMDRDLLFLVRRAFNGVSGDAARRAYPFYLAATIPVVMAYLHLSRQPVRPVVKRMLRTVRAPEVAEQVIFSLAGAVARHLVREVTRWRRQAALAEALDEVFPECFPITAEVVETKIRELAGSECPRVRQVEVPHDFDGRYGGRCLGDSVPSTKGRALNYALALVDETSDMCAFYDAESRPDPRVLMYVAYRLLTDPQSPAIFQGPVFQVRNFYQMGPVCKVAALYQAVAHDWYLPILFRRLPFVGGTNLVVDRALLQSIGGFDPQCLTEDLELGVRAYLEKGVWPQYLPYASSEQTPPTVRSFFRQRLRWGTGHLLVMDKVRAQDGYEADKKRKLLRTLFIKGQVEWTVYQLATFVPPLVLVLFLSGNLDISRVPAAVRHTLNLMSLCYASFTFYTYRRYSPYLDTWSRPRHLAGRVWVWLQLLILPLAAFLFPTPYTTALVLKKLGRHPRSWTKTPRTKE